MIVVASKHDSPHGCALDQFCQLSTRDNSFCLHLNESAYIGGDTQVREFKSAWAFFEKSLTQKYAVTTQSIFVKFSTMLKAKELPSSAVRAFLVNILPKISNFELTFS